MITNSKSRNITELLAPLSIVLALFIFYPDLFFAKSGSLMGDHLVQHYPWAEYLSNSIKAGRLPFWTSLILSGFPIAAESQIGIFYPLNLLLYFFLPIRWAYSYTNLVHFFIAGWGVLLYLRQWRLSLPASFVGAFIFLFGAAYGGAFYNITSLKTICWFPLALYFFERYLEGRARRYLFIISFLVGISTVAGYLQIAVFTWLIFLCYAGFRIFFLSETARSLKDKVSVLLGIFFAFAGAFILALPQLLLTFQLALSSTREGLEEGYAYIGSLSPLAPLTLIDPIVQGFLRGNCLYLGLFPIFLLAGAIPKKSFLKDKFCLLWSAMLITALLLALGQWSPFYILLVKLTQFYAFRFPSKFLVFICFALAVLCARCFDYLWLAPNPLFQKRMRKSAKRYFAALALFAVAAVCFYGFITLGQETAKAFGRWYLESFVHAQPGHPHSLEFYFEKLTQHMVSLNILYDLSLGINQWTLFMLALSAIFSGFVFFSKNVPRFWLVAGLLFLGIDLYGYAAIDIKKDFGRYDELLAPHPVLRQLLMERDSGRLGRVYGHRRRDETLALLPSVNMLYRIPDIGGYSPLVTRRYHETIGRFGSVDDSNLSYDVSEEYALNRLPVLRALGVTHIVSSRPLNHPELETVDLGAAGEGYLYRTTARRMPAFFTSTVEFFDSWEKLRDTFLSEGFNPYNRLLLENPRNDSRDSIENSDEPPAQVRVEMLEGSEESQTWTIRTDRPGYFVVMNSFDVGWKAQINNEQAVIFPAYGIFQAVYISGRGQYQIHFSYEPAFFSGKINL